MYKRGKYTILSNERLADQIYIMVVEGDTSHITTPGQFVNIELQGKFLRRPISVCDYDDATITLIYKVVGRGTDQMKCMAVGQELDMLTGLGNGFSPDSSSRRPILVGGGVGVPPLYNLAKTLLAAGKDVTVVAGFNKASEVFYEEEFRGLGAKLYIATADGSRGTKGFVTDAIRINGIEYDYMYACGPVPMLRALAEQFPGEGQFSFEERMGCGFGGCMGCTCKTKYGYKRICKEGPVLTTDEIIW